MTFPNEKMYIFPIPFPIKAKFFVIGYAAIELFLGVSGSRDGVAHFAHLGGMLFGLVLILIWRKKKKIGGPYV
jgi:membrane associated rhomboid family serine protease